MDCSLPGSSVHGDSPGKNTGVSCHDLLQWIEPVSLMSVTLASRFFVTRILYHLRSPVLIIYLFICLHDTTHQTFPNYCLHIHAEILSHLLPYTCLMLRPNCLSFLFFGCWHLSFSVLLFWQMFLVIFLAQVTNEYLVLLLPPFGPCFHQLKTKILIDRILIVLFFSDLMYSNVSVKSSYVNTVT